MRLAICGQKVQYLLIVREYNFFKLCWWLRVKGNICGVFMKENNIKLSKNFENDQEILSLILYISLNISTNRSMLLFVNDDANNK